MHDLIPRAVEEALQERGIEPVATPDIKDVALEEGRPMTFTATIETIPVVRSWLISRQLRWTARPPRLPTTPIADMLQRLRDRAATYEPVEGRAVAEGDAGGTPPGSHRAGRHGRPPRRRHRSVGRTRESLRDSMRSCWE